MKNTAVVSYCAFIDKSGSNRTGMIRISSGRSCLVAAYSVAADAN
jgi:hypothetical protein